MRNKVSFAQGKRDNLYRSNLILGYKRISPKTRYTHVAQRSLSTNISDNLDRIFVDIRPVNTKPIRSDEDLFAAQNLLVDTFYDGVQFDISTKEKALIGVGYINEYLFGIGGEYLKTPVYKNWSLGAEAYLVKKRDPLSFAALGLSDQTLWSAHAAAYYDIPRYDMRLGFRAGSYLDGDIGGTATLSKYFANGASIQGFTTLTNKEDYTDTGGQTNLSAGLRFVMPLTGLVKPIKANINIDTRYGSFVGDSGQYIDAPFRLIDNKEKLDEAHLSHYWQDISE